MYKFHLRVKSEIDKIFIIDNNEYIEMDMSNIDDSKIFNGEIKNKNTTIKLLSNKLKTQYKLTDLLSKDIKTQKNIIIINVPTEINAKEIIIDVPIMIQKIFNLPKYIVMLDCIKYKLNILSNVNTPEEMLSKGIDPDCKQFIKILNIKPIDDNLDFEKNIVEINNIIDSYLLTVNIYTWEMVKNISID